MIEIAKALLELLEGWRIDFASENELSASKESFLLSETRLRVVVVDDSAMEAELPNPSKGESLLLLTRDKTKSRPLQERIATSQMSGIRAVNLAEFVGGMVGLLRILSHYRSVQQEFLHSEGEGFRYIQPLVVDEQRQQLSRLFDWTTEHEASRIGGVVFLVSDYGEGKTSFCLNYAFRCLDESIPLFGIPLLFLLSECDAGSLEQFVVHRLHIDYGLSLGYLEFARLCRLGVFIPIFDAIDQIGHGAGGMRVERDQAAIRVLSEHGGTVYCTCRLGFFNQYVRPAHAAYDKDSLHILSIRGFGDGEVAERLRDLPGLYEWLTDSQQRKVLDGIYYKPLMLQLIISNQKLVQTLVQKRLEASGQVRGAITEFDLFDQLYRRWLVDAADQLEMNDAIRLCQAITARARLDGMNLVIRLEKLWELPECAGLFRDDSRRHRAIAALGRLKLLDQKKLHRPQEPGAVFRFNAYLEFLVAQFVLDELGAVSRLGERAFIKVAPLTWESRNMIAGRLELRHGEALRRLIDDTRQRHFSEVEYQGANALTLILDRLQRGGNDAEEQASWLDLLRDLRMRHAVLRGLDARGADLTGLDFSYCDLEDADLSFTTLRNANLSHASLKQTRIAEAGALLTTAFIRGLGQEDGGWQLAGGTKNGMLILWDSEQRFPARNRPHIEAVTAVEWDGNGPTLFSTSLDGVLCASQLRDLARVKSFPLGMGSLRAMVSADDGKALILAGDREFVEVRHALDGTELHRLMLPRSSGGLITTLAICGDRLFVGTSEGEIHRTTDWHGTDFEPWVDRLGSRILAMVALPKGELLVLLDGGALCYLNAEGVDQRSPVLPTHADALAYAPEAHLLFLLESNRLFSLSWLPGGTERSHTVARLAYTESSAVLVCSPDGRFVAIGGEYLQVWESGALGLELKREEPMRMDCTGLIIERVRDLDEATEQFLSDRGALVC